MKIHQIGGDRATSSFATLWSHFSRVKFKSKYCSYVGLYDGVWTMTMTSDHHGADGNMDIITPARPLQDHHYYYYHYYKMALAEARKAKRNAVLFVAMWYLSIPKSNLP
jgi:hypothetical protein